MSSNHLPDGFCRPHALAALPPDTPVLVALSGGADSVALLHLLLQAGDGPVLALHVHHGIRGAEADRDADFCRALTKRLGVPFTRLSLDVPAIAAAQKKGLETAARDARYAAIAQYMAAHQLPLLVTAHHADDQLETMLQHLLRGSGLRGLCGIPACRALGGATVVRPMLQMTKAQILQYCKQQHLEYVTDSTNAEACCPRNRLRMEVLPVLNELWPTGAVSAARCARSLAEDEAYLVGEAERFLAREGDAPTLAALHGLPRPIRVRVLRRMLPKPPEATHIDDICALIARARPHATLSLPGCTVCVEDGRLCVQAMREEPPEAYEITLHEGENPLPGDIGMAVVGTPAALSRYVPKKVYKHSTRLSFSSAILNGSPVLRPRRAGDRILSGGKHKLVRKLSCMAPFSLAERARMPLLCDEAGVVAVPFGPLRDGAAKNPDQHLLLLFN